MPAMKETVSYDPNGLVLDDYPVQTAGATIGTAANLVAGAVLGRITASGKYILSLSGASDGSQTPAAILLTDAAAASADAPAVILLSGAVDQAKLTFGASHTAATVETAFRAAGRPIFLKSRTAA
jgi:hypothetical protein